MNQYTHIYHLHVYQLSGVKLRNGFVAVFIFKETWIVVTRVGLMDAL